MAKKAGAKKVENPKEVRVELNSSMTIVFAVKEYKGVHRIDVREFIDTESYTGFTKKGVSAKVEELDKFIEALQTIKKTVVAEDIHNEVEEEEGAEEV